MLAGDEGASNTDPYAIGRLPTTIGLSRDHTSWFLDRRAKHLGIQKRRTRTATKPYMMLAGTPYEHAMIPVGTK